MEPDLGGGPFDDDPALDSSGRGRGAGDDEIAIDDHFFDEGPGREDDFGAREIVHRLLDGRVGRRWYRAHDGLARRRVRDCENQSGAEYR